MRHTNAILVNDKVRLIDTKYNNSRDTFTETLRDLYRILFFLGGGVVPVQQQGILLSFPSLALTVTSNLSKEMSSEDR